MEYRRLFYNKRLLLLFIVLLICNGILFWRGQNTDWNEEFNNLLSSYKGVELEQAAETIQEEIDLRQFYDSVEDSLKNKADINQIKDSNPELWEIYNNDPDKYSFDTSHNYSIALMELKEQIDAQLNYSNHYQNMFNNYNKMLKFNIFNDKNSFSFKNIKKTLNDFKDTKDVPLELNNYKITESFSNYHFTDYIMIIFITGLLLQFLDERKKGLWNIIYATPKGRFRLNADRITILIFVSCIGTILLQVQNIIMGMKIYQCSLNGSSYVQSIPMFQNCSIPITVTQYFILTILVKCSAASLITISLWIIVSSVQNVNFSFVAAGIFLGAEYIAFIFLPIQSNFNLLKFINIFALIDSCKLIRDYQNIKLGNSVVNTFQLSILFLFLLLLIVSILALWINTKKKPIKDPGRMEVLWNKARKLCSKPFCYISMLRSEGHKILWIQRGVIVLILLILIQINKENHDKIYLDAKTALEMSYYEKLYGPVTVDKVTYIKNQFESITLEESEIAVIKQSVLNKVIERKDRLLEINENGKDAWFIQTIGYTYLFGELTKDIQRENTLIALLFLVILIGGILAYENQSHMIYLICSTKNGRLKLWCRKFFWIVFSVIVVMLPIYYVEFINIWNAFGLDGLEAPVQSIPLFDSFPIQISIRLFLCLLYAVRMLTLISIGLICMWLSSLCNKVTDSLIIAVACVVIPAALVYIGLEKISILSFIKPVEITELWIGTGGNGIKCMLSIGFVWILGIVAAFRTIRYLGGK